MRSKARLASHSYPVYVLHCLARFDCTCRARWNRVSGKYGGDEFLHNRPWNLVGHCTSHTCSQPQSQMPISLTCYPHLQSPHVIRLSLCNPTTLYHIHKRLPAQNAVHGRDLEGRNTTGVATAHSESSEQGDVIMGHTRAMVEALVAFRGGPSMGLISQPSRSYSAGRPL